LKLLKPYPVYLILEAGLSFLFGMIWTADTVYQVTLVGLSPLQLVLVGTTLELAIFLFEVPTGVVADVYSRRTSIIIGVFLIGIGFILEGSVPLFFSILAAQMIWGLGYTFTSGATQAWITDEIGEAAAARAFLRAGQVGQVASLVGIGAGMLIGSLRINLPIQIGGAALLVLGMVLLLVMPETGFKPAPAGERSTWGNMTHTFKEGLLTVRRRPALRTILVIGLFYGLFSEGFDRLWTKHILDDFALPAFAQLDPVVLIGAIRAVGMILAVAGTEYLRRRVDTANGSRLVRALLVITVFLSLGLFVFARANLLSIALLAYWLIYLARNLIAPLYTAWINRQADSKVRATIHSLSGQVDAVGQIAGGPLIGMVGSSLSVQAALTASSFLLLPTFPLYASALRSQDNPAVTGRL